MRPNYKYPGNLPLYTVNCHVFSSREQNTIKVNSTGGLCCILASHPVFFFIYIYLCAKSLQSCQQLPPTQNPQDFPSLIQNCNQVRSPGEKLGCSILVCYILWMATNCCAVCQYVKPGALEREKWKINPCQLPERSRDCNTWERWWGRFSMRNVPANALTCDTQLQYHTDPQCFSSWCIWNPASHVNYPLSALKVR